MALSKHYFNELSVNESPTHGLNFSQRAHKFKMEGKMPFRKIYYGFYHNPNIYIIAWAVSQS